MKKIGVWNTAFLGDAVLTMPLLQNLRRAFPAAELHFWVRKGLSALFNPNPLLTAVHEFDKRGGQKAAFSALTLGKQLCAQGYDLWISPHLSPRSALVAFCSGIPTRVGYSSPWYNRLAYTHTIERSFPELPEIERLNRLLLPLGIQPVEEHPTIVLAAEALKVWSRLGLAPGLRQNLPLPTLPPMPPLSSDQIYQDVPRSPLLGLHPGSTWGSKRWLAEHFAAIALKAISCGIRTVIFAGAGEEEAVAAEVKELVLAKAPASQHSLLFDLSARLNLQELAVCLAGLDAYLCNDSGPMHMAWALGTPTVALFGPTTPLLGFAPRGEHSHVLEIPLSCRPCGKHGPQVCPLGHHNCMKMLLPEQAWGVLAPYLLM